MEVKTQPKLRFQGVTFTNVHFDAFQLYDGSKNINISIVPKVFYPEDSKQEFKIVMEVKLHCEQVFNLVLNAIGEFWFENPLEDETVKKSFVNVNAPAIVFPYVRSFISTFTGNLGGVMGSLIIPTQFFQGELEEVVSNQEKQD